MDEVTKVRGNRRPHGVLILSYVMCLAAVYRVGTDYSQVMAGVMNVDAGSRSPASAAQVITVGASDIGDARWAISNWGSSVDIFAAGVDVISCGIASPSVSGLHYVRCRIVSNACHSQLPL